MPSPMPYVHLACGAPPPKEEAPLVLDGARVRRRRQRRRAASARRGCRPSRPRTPRASAARQAPQREEPCEKSHVSEAAAGRRLRLQVVAAEDDEHLLDDDRDVAVPRGRHDPAHLHLGPLAVAKVELPQPVVHDAVIVEAAEEDAAAPAPRREGVAAPVQRRLQPEAVARLASHLLRQLLFSRGCDAAPAATGRCPRARPSRAAAGVGLRPSCTRGGQTGRRPPAGSRRPPPRIELAPCRRRLAPSGTARAPRQTRNRPPAGSTRRCSRR